MRTTISLDDRLAKQVRRQASARGLSVSAFIAATLDDALNRNEPSDVPPFRLIAVGGTGVRSGIDLDRPRSIETADEVSRFLASRSALNCDAST